MNKIFSILLAMFVCLNLAAVPVRCDTLGRGQRVLHCVLEAPQNEMAQTSMVGNEGADRV